MIAWVCVDYSRRIHPLFLRSRQLFDRMILTLAEAVEGVSVIKGFAREPEVAAHFARDNRSVEAQQAAIIWRQSLFSPGTDLLAQSSLVVLLLYGGKLVIDRSLPLGAGLIVFAGLLQQFAAQIMMLAQIANGIQESLTGARRVFDLLDAPVGICPPTRASVLSASFGAVRFENVSFRHAADAPVVLRDVSFAAEPGECVAIVGETGSGKSALLHLIPRFYDPTEGCVVVDGVDTRAWDLQALRKRVGFVFQENFLFSDTVAANIAFGVPDASREAIAAAARAACAHDFIEALPHGYETVLGESGVDLSGGQRQRLTIARAILAAPAILVLDDPTAALDPETEHEILAAIEQSLAGRTSFVVAHRLSTLRRADHILVFERGQIVQTGTHAQLVREDGPYRLAALHQMVDEESRRILSEEVFHAELDDAGETPFRPAETLPPAASQVALAPSEKLRGSGIVIIRRMLACMQPHAAKRDVVFITTVIRAAQRPLLFWAVAAIINGPIAKGDYRATALWTLGFAGLLLSTTIVMHWRSRQMGELGEALMHDLRGQIFQNLQRMPLSYFHKTKLGRILSRMISDMESTRRGVQLGFFIAQEFLQLAGCAALMLYYNWALFLVLTAISPVIILAKKHFHPRIHLFSRHAAESSSRLTGALAEAVRGIRVIQGFTRQERGEQIFGRHVDQLTEDNVKLSAESALYIPLLGVTGQVYVAAMLVVGGYCALHGYAGLNVGSFVAFFFIPTSFFISLQAIANYCPQFFTSLVGAERVFQLIDLTPGWSDAADAAELPDPRVFTSAKRPMENESHVSGLESHAPGARIEFRQVSFGYDPARLVLQEISLVAEPGELVAFVGPTGSGKSSIINLIAKFHLPTAGELFIDGREIRTLRSASLRAQIGVVHQANFLFTGTVLENVRFSRPSATDAEARAAIDALDCRDLFESLPRGLNAEVREGGSNLSIGQRQLVCFARALLADPRILILDEATSAVDPVTEHRLQRALARLLAGRTSFVVAHRLSTIIHADQILVLDHGSIVERGTHYELLKRRRKYHALYRQFAFVGITEEEDRAEGQQAVASARS